MSAVDWMTDLTERELSLDKALSPAEKGLYIAIRTLRPKSIAELAHHLSISPASASRGCAILAKRGWVKIEAVSREKRVWAVVPEFVQVRQAALLSEIYHMQPYKGEFLLKVLLDGHVLSRNYVDNARPKWLVNPTTEEQMEIDRFYPAEDDGMGGQGQGASGVLGQAGRSAQNEVGRSAHGQAGRTAHGQAGKTDQGQACKTGHGFEFHGPQHFRTTKAYPNVEELRKTQARDLMKKAICADHGVKLIVVTYKDLSPKGILKRIPDTLPTGPVDFDGSFMKKVGELCNNYRNNAINLR
ncbi:MAG TPA: MarR family transcriptional regulator [Firmicutes bacterium]|nr:MarR family transcriptional regulator [Candidatus Fermentithermobacillaceae bacterium]